MTARILVVDDQEQARKLTCARLRANYYQVIAAENGEQAISLARQETPDVILLDVMMPGMDGYDVISALKASGDTSWVPVVMLTALEGSEDRLRGLQAGADDFLTKPVEDDLLLARVGSLVRYKRLLEQWRLREQTVGDLVDRSSVPTPFSQSTTGARVALLGDSAVELKALSDMIAEDEHDVTILGLQEFDWARVSLNAQDALIFCLDGKDDLPLQLVSALRASEAGRTVPVVLVADTEDIAMVLKGLDIGVSDFITRPCDAHELLARVRMQVRKKRYQDHLQDVFFRNLSMAITDGLTTLHNRHYFETHLEAAIKRQSSDPRPLCLMFMDIDRFKAVNDSHGHVAGDAVLVHVAQRIQANVRGGDLAARYGGEEFCVLLPDTTMDDALQSAARLRRAISQAPISLKGDADKVAVTVSIGLAEYRDGDTVAHLVHRADQALYQAKAAGRDRVEIYKDG